MEPNTKALDQFDLELAEAHGQRTQEWRDIRAGKFTASQMWRIMSAPRGKTAKENGDWSDTAWTYIMNRVAEELTGQMGNSGLGPAVEWGVDLEPVAKEYFTKVTGKDVGYAGFKIYNAHTGGSPDGFVGDFLLEIKCPFNSSNHIQYMLLDNELLIRDYFPEYWWQIQSNLLFNDSPMCYFVSFDPRFPEKQKMKILEVYAHKEDQERLKVRIEKAIASKKALIELLT